MSISQHEQEVLDSVADDLIGSGPELAAMLAMFTRLTANEEMPPYERVWRPVRAPSAGSAKPGAGPEKTRIQHVLSRRAAWRLLMLVLTVAFFALAVISSRGAGRGVCTVPWTAACQQVHGSPSQAPSSKARSSATGSMRSHPQIWPSPAG